MGGGSGSKAEEDFHVIRPKSILESGGRGRVRISFRHVSCFQLVVVVVVRMGCVDNASGKGFGRSQGKKRKEGRWRHLALIPRYTINYYIRITRISSSVFPPPRSHPENGGSANRLWRSSGKTAPVFVFAPDDLLPLPSLLPLPILFYPTLQLIAVTWQTG